MLGADLNLEGSMGRARDRGLISERDYVRQSSVMEKQALVQEVTQ